MTGKNELVPILITTFVVEIAKRGGKVPFSTKMNPDEDKYSCSAVSRHPRTVHGKQG